MTDAATLLVETTPEQTDAWWKSAVVYQIYPRSFADSNGDGIGDLPGILEHIDYLDELGIDVVWLSPIYASPHADNGYDISDYQSIDPNYGTLDDFDRLVAELHRRGIKIVMDLVVNHTSDEHPWFIQSASGPSSPKRDWYWWRTPRAGHVGGERGAEPTNWESFFSGSTWEFDSVSEEYYLHLFDRKQPDLNWENPEVRTAIYSMMRWWLDRGVNGFRMDVINLISKDTALPDGDVQPDGNLGDGFRHFSYGPRIHEFLHEMNVEVFGTRVGEFVTIGEMPGATVEQARLYTDPARHELDMVFQFEHVGIDQGVTKWQHVPFDLLTLKSSFVRWQDGLGETGWNSLYWNNHDQPRIVSRFGNDGRYWSESARLLAAVLHLQRGTPFVYQGEELGMTNVPFTALDDLRDIESLNYVEEVLRGPDVTADSVLANIRRVGRDNARTPMQWSAAANGGFSAGTPWIDTNENYTTINAASQRGTAGSVFEFYRSLIQLRHDEPAITHGNFRILAQEHPSLFAFTRTTGTTQLLVIANFSDAPTDLEKVTDIDLGIWSAAQLLLANYASATVEMVLHPWEVRILRRHYR